MTTPAKHQATRHLSGRIPATVLAIVLAGFLLEWAREILAQAVVHASYMVTDGTTAGMRFGGWLMFVAGPIAAVWYGHDFRRAVATARSPRTGLTRFAGRRRGAGHRARRPVSFWFNRAPLALPIALALAFVVPGGVIGDAPSNWANLPGGVDFMLGVRWSLIATFAAGALVLVTEVLLLSEPKRWVSSTVSVVALLTPVAALALLIR